MMKSRKNAFPFFRIAITCIFLFGCASASDTIDKPVIATAVNPADELAVIDPENVPVEESYPVATAVETSAFDEEAVDEAALLDEAEAYDTSVDISHRYKYKVRGKQYKVFSSAESFQEIGIASWYGPNFHGKKTANGEIYNMHAMTAAHKTLPLGSRVRVTNLENGKKITVRINDRGPFHNGRIIDLSKKAARRLGMLGKGFARVHVKALR